MSRLNENTLMKKTWTLKHNISNMNNNAANEATNQTSTLDHEATIDAIFFASVAPAATATAVVSTISPDDHFLSSGLKMDTEIFSKGSINIMANRDTIDTTPSPDAPDGDSSDDAAQDSGYTDSYSPHSFINNKFFS